MTDAVLAALAAKCLSGPGRVDNVRQLARLLRVNWAKWERVWVAAGLDGTAPLVCHLNRRGLTAEKHHHPIAAKLQAWAESQ